MTHPTNQDAEKRKKIEEAALIDAEDLGGDALAYFLTGFKRGAIWQSQQSNEELDRYRDAMFRIIDLSHDKETTWARIAYDALNP